MTRVLLGLGLCAVCAVGALVALAAALFAIGAGYASELRARRSAAVS
ncbi:hypothetical protein [Streptomyces fungicidicus]